MSRRMQLVRAVAVQAEALYERATEFGSRTARLVVGERGRSQITGLEAVAAGALTVSEILDYIKRQAAKHKEWRAENLVQDLLAYLGGDVLDRRFKVIDAGKHLDPSETLFVKLSLMREFIRAMSAHDAFARATAVGSGTERGSDAHLR